MMKILLILFVLLLGAGYGVVQNSLLPYRMYQEILGHDFKHELYTSQKPPKEVLFTTKFQFQRVKAFSQESDELWQTMHLKNFSVPFPLRHPIFSVRPLIRYARGEPLLGFHLINPQNDIIFSFIEGKSYSFRYYLERQKIFTLPLFQNTIIEKSRDQLWNDVFKRDLRFEEGLDEGPPWKYWSLFQSFPLPELVYNLYILDRRREILPQNMLEFSYVDKRGWGSVLLENREDRRVDSRYFKERFYILGKNKVRTFHLLTKKNDTLADALRKRFILKVDYKPTREEAAVSLYERFKQQKFDQRRSRDALVFLYTAWSHDLKNRTFLKEMIQFLEKSDLEISHIKPFYEFSYKNFKTTFSSRDDQLIESQEEKLKRQMKEELESELKAIDSEEINPPDSSFETGQDRMRYYLNKAKESGENTDQIEKVLRH